MPASVVSNSSSEVRRKLAIFTGPLSSQYLMDLSLGAARYANQQGWHCVTFSGGALDDPFEFSGARSRLFDVVSPDFFDGLIVASGSLMRHVDEDRVNKFLKRFKNLPIVSIGRPTEGNTHVHFDNKYCIWNVVEHLVVKHGFQRIAFVGGPKNHWASGEKLTAYRAALEYHGISFDPEWVVHGDLKRSAACFAPFFAAHKTKIQAVVTVTDLQAFEIIDFLQGQGLRVPEDVAVTGCSGLAEGIFTQPTLTTVQESAFELGWSAARSLIDGSNGIAQPAEIVVPGIAVLRRSCGCDGRIEEEVEFDEFVPKDVSGSGLLQSLLKLSKFNGVYPDINEIERIKRLPEVDESEESVSRVLVCLREILDRRVAYDDGVVWLSLLSGLLRKVKDSKSTLYGDSTDFKELERRLSDKIHGDMARVFGYQKFEYEKSINLLQELKSIFSAEFDRASVAYELKSLNFGCFCVGVFERANYADDPVESVFSLQRGAVQEYSGERFFYPSSQLLPVDFSSFDEPVSLVAMPLWCQENFYGLIFADFNGQKGSFYESLQSTLSGALQNKNHIYALSAAEEKFSDIASSSSDWLWECDLDGIYTYCSEGVEKILGYSSGEMVGKSIFDFLLSSENAYIKLMRDKIFADFIPFEQLEMAHRHRNGSVVTLLISGVPIRRSGGCQGYRGVFKDITELKDQAQRIRELAFSDELTGLGNRTLFNSELEVAIECAKRSGQSFALFFIGMNKFKLTNETFGHEAGDFLLKAVAQRLRTCVRELDTLARLGGDEFAIIFPNIQNQESAEQVARRIVADLAPAAEVLGQSHIISGRMGIAMYPRDGQTTQSLMRSADKAMHRSKAEGRNHYSFFDTSLEAECQRRSHLDKALRQSLQVGGFELHYQPQIKARTGQVVAVEALIRWHTDELGYVSPAEFIPLAEEVGLIDQIGLWVFVTACEQAGKWWAAGIEVRVAVNVSARQLKNPRLAQQLIDILKLYEIQPHWLEIEITETALVDNESTAREILQTLSDYGLSIALDDFGTGFASLSSLKKFPVDTVKIDRSFISDCLTEPDSAGIVNAIIHMAFSLNLHTVAEGVETAEQESFLRAVGCEVLQGYFYSRPLPAEALTEWLWARQI